MESTLPCRDCKGMCCGPVSVSQKELENIRKKVKSMPKKLRDNLRKQERFYGTCIFYDNEKNRCGIYSARPKACKMFGYYAGMACFRNPELATKYPKEDIEVVGILSSDYTWKDFDF